MAVCYEGVDRIFDRIGGIERRFQKVAVEIDREGFEILILLASQPRNRECLDIIKIFDVA